MRLFDARDQTLSQRHMEPSSQTAIRTSPSLQRVALKQKNNNENNYGEIHLVNVKDRKCKMTMGRFRMDLEREVWRTAVLHFGLERIDGLREVGSET